MSSMRFSFSSFSQTFPNFLLCPPPPSFCYYTTRFEGRHFQFIFPHPLTRFPGSPSIVQNTASPPLSVVATPKPVPQKATKTATPTKKQQEQPPAPANMLTTTTPARILLNTPQNKTKINTKTRTQTQTHNKETLATGCPPCPSPPPPESPAGLSSPVSRPWTPSSNQSQTQTASSAQHAPFAQ